MDLEVKKSGSMSTLFNSKGVATLEYAIIIMIFVLGSLAAVAQTGAAMVRQFERSQRQMATDRPMGSGLQGEGEQL